MNIFATCSRQPWNKGKLVGQKAPLRLRDIWAIRIRLQIAERTRDLALFDLAIDSKLRACDLIRLRVRDVAHGEHVSPRAMVMQQKTLRPVQFEITEQTRFAIAAWRLIKQDNAESTSSVPGLSRIPGLKWLFGSTSKSRDRTELIVLITPRVVTNAN